MKRLKLILTIFLALLPNFFAQNALGQTSVQNEFLDPTVSTAYEQTITSGSSAGLRSAILAIQDGSIRANQILLVLIKVNEDPALRNTTSSRSNFALRADLASILFDQPLSSQGLNLSHLTLLTALYVSTVQNPVRGVPPPRGYLGGEVLLSRLLDVISSLLNVEDARANLPRDIQPLERLKQLLVAASQKTQPSKTSTDQINESLKTVDSSSRDFPLRLASAERKFTSKTSPLWNGKQFSLRWLVIGTALVTLLVILRRRSKRIRVKGTVNE